MHEVKEMVSFQLPITLLNELDQVCGRLGTRRSRVLRALVYILINDSTVYDKVSKLIRDQLLVGAE